jgi:hypothetical protein
VREAADLTIELVEKQLLRRHSDEAGPQRLREHALHLGLFALGRALPLLRGPIQAHGGGPHVGVPDEGRQVGTERSRFQRLDVLLGVRPGLVVVDGADDVFAGDCLDSAEDVACVHTVDMDCRQRTRSQHYGRHAVADDRVVGHQVIEQRVLASVNEICEQI